MLKVLDVNVQEIPTMFSACHVNEQEHFLPFFHSNVGFLVQFEALLVNCQGDNMINHLSSKKIKLKSLLKDARVATSCYAAERELYSALLATNVKAYIFL